MSFSGEVKEELVKQMASARHCQIAELAAILIMKDSIHNDGESIRIEFSEETSYCIRKVYSILKKTLQIRDEYEEEKLAEMNQLSLQNADEIKKIIDIIKYKSTYTTVNPVIIKSVCCKRAFLRGAFLSIGSMSNPEKGYHLEFVCENSYQAKQISEVLQSFDIHAKSVQRKKYEVVYIKESEEIVELLNVIGAHISLMNLENLRILKDMRNSINRRVNCEAANITKTVNAATKQIDDITYIRNHYGFDDLSPQLREIAEVRLENPDASLKELGEYVNPKVGKSGVNHRLRKLGELADRLREANGEIS